MGRVLISCCKVQSESVTHYIRSVQKIFVELRAYIFYELIEHGRRRDLAISLKKQPYYMSLFSMREETAVLQVLSPLEMKRINLSSVKSHFTKPDDVTRQRISQIVSRTFFTEKSSHIFPTLNHFHMLKRIVKNTSLAANCSRPFLYLFHLLIQTKCTK